MSLKAAEILGSSIPPAEGIGSVQAQTSYTIILTHRVDRISSIRWGERRFGPDDMTTTAPGCGPFHFGYPPLMKRWSKW
jgi:hypothetical protein